VQIGNQLCLVNGIISVDTHCICKWISSTSNVTISISFHLRLFYRLRKAGSDFTNRL
jgi:hypothetical protein